MGNWDYRTIGRAIGRLESIAESTTAMAEAMESLTAAMRAANRRLPAGYALAIVPVPARDPRATTGDRLAAHMDEGPMSVRAVRWEALAGILELAAILADQDHPIVRPSARDNLRGDLRLLGFDLGTRAPSPEPVGDLVGYDPVAREAGDVKPIEDEG